MNTISFLGVGLVVLGLSPCFGQSTVIAQGTVKGNNFGFYWQNRLEPFVSSFFQESANNLGNASGYNGDMVYRVVMERTRKVYFGYQVRVEPVPQGMYRLTFQPLDLNAETMKRIQIDDPDWKKLDLGSPAGWPLSPFQSTPDIVAELDVIAVDLMMNPGTNQKIVDYFVLQQPQQGWSFNQLDAVKPGFSYPAGNPRDFAVEDADLRLAQLRLKVNGKSEQVLGMNDLAGPIVWLYAPGRGRYILTLAAHPEAGFRKAGEVRGSLLNFGFGDQTFSITSTKPITTADSAFNLYVLQDPSWKPTNANAPMSSFLMGVADQELMDSLNRLGFRKARP